VTVLAATITSPIANVTVDYVAGSNGTGTGTLAATGTDTLAWTPPGGTQGAAVTILNGETKILEGGGTGGANKYVRVTRTSAAVLSGTATVTLAEVFGNERSAWTTSPAPRPRRRQRVPRDLPEERERRHRRRREGLRSARWARSASATAAARRQRLGVITTTGSFADWPDSGFCHIKTNAGGHARDRLLLLAHQHPAHRAGGRPQPARHDRRGGRRRPTRSTRSRGSASPRRRPPGQLDGATRRRSPTRTRRPSGVTWNTGITAGDRRRHRRPEPILANEHRSPPSCTRSPTTGTV
jgi:hypothetical protein